MKIIAIIALVLAVAACSMLTMLFVSERGDPKICIVRMPEVMDRYQGALDAGARMRQRQEVIQSNIDTMIQRIQADQTIGDLDVKRAQVQQYVQAVESKDAEDKAAISKQLISHIRSAAETIAEQKSLELVLAVTDESFVLSRVATVDITEDVLRELKRSYRNEFKKP